MFRFGPDLGITSQNRNPNKIRGEEKKTKKQMHNLARSGNYAFPQK